LGTPIGSKHMLKRHPKEFLTPAKLKESKRNPVGTRGRPLRNLREIEETTKGTPWKMMDGHRNSMNVSAFGAHKHCTPSQEHHTFTMTTQTHKPAGLRAPRVTPE